MIYTDCLKYGKGLLLASLTPLILLLLYTCSLPPATKCWTFQLAVAFGSLVVLSTRLAWVRALVIGSFVLKFVFLESLDEQSGTMPLVSMMFAFILL